MILTQISYLDCVAFLVFLAPQLLTHVGFWSTTIWVLQALPFLGLQMPLQFIWERYLERRENRTPFFQQATAFQDIVIRCVRYAFANMPPSMGRVFFSKAVALPFLRFRMLRHLYLRSPIKWREVRQTAFQGVWITHDDTRQPDVVVYYCHGGGFSMGSSFFYMEFLIAWVSLLRDAGYENPALFALEYTLVPDATYPTQIQQALAGYGHVLSIAPDSSRVCVGGDSAGGTLILSLLLWIADHPEYRDRLPGYATLISPWITMVSERNRNTASDYLDSERLDLYGSQYVGRKVKLDDSTASPGNCGDLKRWKRATPTQGWLFTFGPEEVLAPETCRLTELLKTVTSSVKVEEVGLVHAWPVASLYLGDSRSERLYGLEKIVRAMRSCLERGKT